MILAMYIQYMFILLYIFFFYGCSYKVPDDISSSNRKVSVAFMADVHFHDVFAEFHDGSFEGLPLVSNNDTLSATIRTMESQLTSTRLFNENYFAFKAALDDVVNRGIKFVAFPGDFSDDGQPVHIRGFRKILDEYHEKFGIEFFVITGNHDPGRPFSTPAGKFNYLGDDGMRQPVFSLEHPVCTGQDRRGRGSLFSHEVICTDEVMHYGYRELFNELGHHGMSPKESYLYFETPFSTYSIDEYDYEIALAESKPEERMYEICREGTGGRFRDAHFTNCFDVMDMSYLVEPVEGLWLLAIDGNVYIPNENADFDWPENPRNFSSAGNAGYNAIISHKSHLIEWIEEIASRADELNKHLVAFSHYPAVDFYNDAGEEIMDLWGRGRFQTLRLPEEEVSRMLASTGLQLHVGGHMHMNDTAISFDEATGNRLFNIQVPSIAGYVPAYKIIHLSNTINKAEVETVTLNDVPGFDTLFPLYQKEWEFLNDIGYEGIWSRDVMSSGNYYEFNDWHMRELSRLRFLPREWPESLKDKLATMTGKDILFDALSMSSSSEEFYSDSVLNHIGFTIEDFSEWDGIDLSIDFYRIRNAGSLAFRDIPVERLEQYAVLDYLYNQPETLEMKEDANRPSFAILFSVLNKFATGYPDDHFVIDFEDGSIRSLREIRNPFDD